MNRYLVLYNPLACNKKGLENARLIEDVIKESEFEYKSVIGEDLSKIISDTSEDVKIVLAGGDGTLNKFINSVDTDTLEREIIYFPAGSGNDFMHDIYPDGSAKYVVLNPYVKNLPTVEVNGVKSRFINGIGYGIDGYCCEVGDKLRETASDKPINYAGIAIKGLLFYFKSLNATVTVDGNTRTFKNVWLVPTMFGRFYGGGMNATPNQNRLNGEKKVSTLVFTGKSRLKTLAIFPSIFKGEHVKHTDVITVIPGKEVCVSFDRPCALQIDGETVLGVTSYKVNM